MSTKALSPSRSKNVFQFGMASATPKGDVADHTITENTITGLQGSATKGMPTTTPQNVSIPKLNFEKEEKPAEEKKHNRNASNSSRGSIGRKERLRNALTGRSDGSEGGADQPKELPDEEMVDFMYLYDISDPFCRVAVEKHDAHRSQGSNKSLGSMEDKMGEIDQGDSPEKIDIPED